jgi:hypothetical protein
MYDNCGIDDTYVLDSKVLITSVFEFVVLMAPLCLTLCGIEETSVFDSAVLKLLV